MYKWQSRVASSVSIHLVICGSILSTNVVSEGFWTSEKTGHGSLRRRKPQVDTIATWSCHPCPSCARVPADLPTVDVPSPEIVTFFFGTTHCIPRVEISTETAFEGLVDDRTSTPWPLCLWCLLSPVQRSQLHAAFSCITSFATGCPTSLKKARDLPPWPPWAPLLFSNHRGLFQEDPAVDSSHPHSLVRLLLVPSLSRGSTHL